MPWITEALFSSNLNKASDFGASSLYSLLTSSSFAAGFFFAIEKFGNLKYPIVYSRTGIMYS
jgi:hypothetical protein